MDLTEITLIVRQGIFQVFMLIGPVLGAALIIGLVVAIFQAATSIQEQTLTFLPKLAAILIMLAMIGGWMFTRLEEYFRMVMDMIPQMG